MIHPSRSIFRILLCILAVFSTGKLNAQQDYVIMDGVRFDNVKLWDPGDWSNTNRCILRIGDSAVVYTPHQVQEYGFKDGRVYYASDVMVKEEMKKVFLRKLVDGKTDLYFYEDEDYKTYFLGPDTSLLTEVSRRANDGESYHTQLQRLTMDCPGIDDAARVVAYRKNYLTEFVERYNRCEVGPFPYLRYGLVAGYGFTRLMPPDEPDYFGEFDYTFHGGFSLGIFVDQPILLSRFSVHGEVLYSRLGFSYYYQSSGQDYDLIVQSSAVSVPVLCRLILPVKKADAFVNAGGCLEYNFKNETGIYTAAVSEPGVIEIDRLNNSPVISDIQLGYVIGAGIEYQVVKNHPLLFELRFSRQYRAFQQEPSAGKSVVQLITAIKF